MFIDLIKMIFIQIKKRKMRTFLTMLQVMLGIATIVLVFTIVFSLWDGVRETQKAFSDSVYNFTIERQMEDPRGHGHSMPQHVITESDIVDIKENISTIEYISPLRRSSDVLVNYNDHYFRISAKAGVSPDFLQISDMEMEKGTFFSSGDYEQGAGVAVISSRAASQIFPGQSDPIGQEVVVYRNWRFDDNPEQTTYTIIGVFSSGAVQDIYSPLLGNQLLVPATYRDRNLASPVVYSSAARTQVSSPVPVQESPRIKVDTESGVESGAEPIAEPSAQIGTEPGTELGTENGIKSSAEPGPGILEKSEIINTGFRYSSLYLRIGQGQYNETLASLSAYVSDRYGTDMQVQLRAEDGMAGGFDQALTYISMVMGGFGFLIIIISSIGILSTMMVNILERTRQIGIEKALGASRKLVFYKFNVEAIIMASGGGLLGILLAFLLSDSVLVLLETMPVSIRGGLHPMAILLGLLVSVITGWLFGIYPSLQASGLDATDALRN